MTKADNWLRGRNKDAGDFRKLVKLARKQGWEVNVTKSGHILFVGPDGSRVVAAMTSRSGKSILRIKNLLKKAGLDLEGR